MLSRCCPDAALRMMACNIFSPFWPFQVDAGTMLYRLIVTSICKLMRIGRWFEPKYVLFCQLVEVIREADAYETSGEFGLALPGNLVGESQFRIPS